MTLIVQNYAQTANQLQLPYQDLHVFSPADKKILSLIMQFLPLTDLYHEQLACKKFLEAANYDIVWERKAVEAELPSTYAPNLSTKARVRRFIKECRAIKAAYPQELCEAFGGAKNIVRLPKLSPLRKNTLTGSLNFVSPSMMLGAKVKRGITADGRPFMSIAAKIIPQSPDEPATVNVVTLFRRYLNNDTIWTSESRTLSFIPRSPDGIRPLNRESYEYIGKLLRGEPCTYNNVANHHSVVLTNQQEHLAGAESNTVHSN